MTEAARVVRRRQYCALCGQLMFEFYRSPDGHFGLEIRPGTRVFQPAVRVA